MALAFFIGRIIVGLYFLENAYGHIFKSAGMVGYAQSKGMKSASTAKFAIISTGFLMALGGLSVLFGVRPHYGIACLIIFLLGASFKMHAYWKVTDPMAKFGDRIQFMKNVAIIGALLMALAIPWSAWAYPFGW